jgi:hypothetical protein
MCKQLGCVGAGLGFLREADLVAKKHTVVLHGTAQHSTTTQRGDGGHYTTPHEAVSCCTYLLGYAVCGKYLSCCAVLCCAVLCCAVLCNAGRHVLVMFLQLVLRQPTRRSCQQLHAASFVQQDLTHTADGRRAAAAAGGLAVSAWPPSCALMRCRCGQCLPVEVLAVL